MKYIFAKNNYYLKMGLLLIPLIIFLINNKDENRRENYYIDYGNLNNYQ
jgi:hypothetical protein